MEKLLEVENLSVSYFTYAGEVQSVRGISFDVKKGKTTALVGESGCGKSVTAKSLMGLIEKPGKVKPESKIIYQGKELTGYTEKEWNTFRGKECSMVFQDALVSLNPTMKVGKQIAENLKNHESSLSKEEIYQKSLEMLKQTGVPDPEGCMNKYPHELSGGMRESDDCLRYGDTSAAFDRRRADNSTGCDNTGTDYCADGRVAGKAWYVHHYYHT